MTSKTIVCALALASLGFGSLSFAQGDDQRYNQRGMGGEPSRFEQRGPMHREARDSGSRDFDHRHARNDRQFGTHGERHFDARGPRFQRGERIPMAYRNRQRAMNNWHARHLNAPAHGQQWVQVDADYALIAIATGVIAQLVLNR